MILDNVERVLDSMTFELVANVATFKKLTKKGGKH